MVDFYKKRLDKSKRIGYHGCRIIMENKMVDKIIQYESGNMDDEEMISFFQELIDSGLCWKLQGHYGRTASSLIEEGLCNESR